MKDQQLRLVAGEQQIWDSVLQDWRSVQPLDRIVVEKPGKKPEKCRCPRCGAAIDLLTYFSGWEIESLDPETGDKIEVVDGERSEIHEEEFLCESRCGWRGDYAWYDGIRNGILNEEKEEDGKVQTIPEEADVTAFHRFVWRNTTPDPF